MAAQRKVAWMLALFCTSVIGAEPRLDVCSTTNQKAEREKAMIPTNLSGRKVIGTGRLYFYTAPGPTCRQKNLFLVPGDLLEAYADYGNYTQVVYWNSKNGNEAEGWVETARLVETGTGIGPGPEKK
jgi:hypothetical protein